MNIHAVWLQKEGYHTVTPREFYRAIFPVGELEAKGEYTPGRYTGIIVAVTNKKKKDGRTKAKRYSLTDDLEAVETVIASDDFCVCAPLSYAGKRRTADKARFLYAIAVDVDGLKVDEGEDVGLAELMAQTQRKMWATHTHNILPVPTFIVCSGHGVHLYYVLERPVPLYREYAEELQALKRDLTRRIWNSKVTNEKRIQQGGIYQGFRMPGTITKDGGRAVAFQTGERVTLEYLNQFVKEDAKAKKAAGLVTDRGGLRLEEAKKLYPEWYERRIERKEARGVWHVNRALYEWWRSRVADEAAEGHRYYCMMMLAIYAKKCSFYDAKHNPNPVTLEELERDAYSLLEVLDARTKNENNHFGADDIQDALEAYQDRLVIYPRAMVEQMTALQIRENKRKKQKQEDHLAEARAVRDVRAERRGERWDAHNGRKDKAAAVIEWRKNNPTGKKADCIRETGITDKTVAKWWNVSIDRDTIPRPAAAAVHRKPLEFTEEEKQKIMETIKILERSGGDKKEVERLRKFLETGGFVFFFDEEQK